MMEVTEQELEEWNNMTALNKQVAGNHYKDQPIQPVEYIYANAIGYFEGLLTSPLGFALTTASPLQHLYAH